MDDISKEIQYVCTKCGRVHFNYVDAALCCPSVEELHILTINPQTCRENFDRTQVKTKPLKKRRIIHIDPIYAVLHADDNLHGRFLFDGVFSDLSYAYQYITYSSVDDGIGLWWLVYEVKIGNSAYAYKKLIFKGFGSDIIAEFDKNAQ